MQKSLKKIICLTPVYNDWDSFLLLINKIEEINLEYIINIIAINDYSTDETPTNILNKKRNIEVLNLKLNIGHQRAIAVGLQYIFSKKDNFDYLIVLDSDGEDCPEDIEKLIVKCEEENNKRIIFAQRSKRSETFLFKIGYFFYKVLFFILTGKKINFGNFSCIPFSLLNKIILNENLWNHYSGTIIQSKIPFSKLILNRGKRYYGKSKMNFTSLVLHGLSAISVYFDSISIRILIISIFGMFCCFFSFIIILYIKLFTSFAIPGWASNIILIIFNITLQLSSVTLIVLLMQLRSRKDVKSPSEFKFKKFIHLQNNY